MKSLNEITRYLHVIVATLAVWSQGKVQEVFNNNNLGKYAIVGTIILAVIGMQLTDRVAITAIDRLRFVRRLLSGDNDIEGDWVDVITDAVNPDKIVKAEYCRIRFQQGGYTLSGNTWTLDGQWRGDFVTSGGANYIDRVLEYHYRTGLRTVGGFGVLVLTPIDSLPSDWFGRYIQEGSKTIFITLGKRVSPKLRRVSLDDRRDAALEFARQVDLHNLPHLDPG
jgi:hypothetical protein